MSFNATNQTMFELKDLTNLSDYSENVVDNVRDMNANVRYNSSMTI